MSLSGYDKFNIWFPALVGGLVIGFLAAAFWDLGRRRIWLLASRLWSGVLEEVGLDNPYLSHAKAEEYHREISKTLSGFASQINFLVSAKSPMADSSATESSRSPNSSVSSNSGATSVFDIEAQGGFNRLPGTPVHHTDSNCKNHVCPGTTLQGVVTADHHSRPIAVTVTAFFPDDTSDDVIRLTKRLFKMHANGPVKRIKSSIILQASLLIDPCVLFEIGELAKKCMSVENRCTFQLGNWATLYYNAGKVHLHILKEGDVPVNVEARWQDGRRTRISMRGLYLTGTLIKAGTQLTSIILKSAGPVTQGRGDLDELDVTTEGLDVPRKDSLIYASKLVERADGISFIVRSDARFILPPLKKLLLLAYTLLFVSLTFSFLASMLGLYFLSVCALTICTLTAFFVRSIWLCIVEKEKFKSVQRSHWGATMGKEVVKPNWFNNIQSFMNCSGVTIVGLMLLVMLLLVILNNGSLTPIRDKGFVDATSFEFYQ